MQDKHIKMKPSNILRVWSGLFTIGGTFVCAFLAWQGLKFNSSYSLLYLGTGVFLFPFFANMMFWGLPAYIPGKVIFEIIPGENGIIKSKNKVVPIREINDIEMVRNILTLYNSIRIKTTDGKNIYIKTYNVIPDYGFFEAIDNYAFPYMNPYAKEVWNRKIENNQLLKDLNFVRKDHKIDQ
ncbi:MULTISPECIES: DUF5381 family protein [Metabacillus]|uniref:YfjD family protein n=1 Tax=Metabacillus indicus TaxID=246786 RepID=A0A084H177_METID|nr:MULTISPECIES: DUF5381 family protein [Metabacillus]KEZ53339.1 hypothetical protein GS18_0206985 [Metabacillus indicus]